MAKKYVFNNGTVKIFTDHFPEHGCGAIKSYNVQIGKTIIDFWKGGYGNIRPPMGFWHWHPTFRYYKGIAFHAFWFSCGISIKSSWY